MARNRVFLLVHNRDGDVEGEVLRRLTTIPGVDRALGWTWSSAVVAAALTTADLAAALRGVLDDPDDWFIVSEITTPPNGRMPHEVWRFIHRPDEDGPAEEPVLQPVVGAGGPPRSSR